MSTTDHWFPFCRPILEELNPLPDLDPRAFVSGLVARAREVNADTLVMMVDEGGYPVYPSRLAPMSDHLGGTDLLGMIEQAVHGAGLRFGAGFLGVHCHTFAAAEHPEWLMRDSEGAPIVFNTSHLLCPNSPYGRFLAAYVAEVLERYPVDYLYVEGGYFRHGCCYCEYCRTQFRETYGTDLPSAGGTPAFLRFRRDGVTRLHARIRRAAREISPATVVVGTSYHDWFDTTDFPRFRLQVDMAAKENQWGHDGGELPLHEPGLAMSRMRAHARRPIIGTWWINDNVDLNYHNRSPAHARLTFLECLAHGAAVQPHIQTGLEVDASLAPVIRELFDVVEKVRPFMVGAEPVPFVGVLDGPHAYGTCVSLIERHLPFSFLTMEDLEEGRVRDHRVIMMSDARDLSDAALGTLERHVRSGAGLVCLGRCAERDEHGLPRRTNPLLELAGVASHGIEVPMRAAPPADTYPVYWRVQSPDPAWQGLRGRLLAWRGPYLELEPGPDCATIAGIEDLDFARMHKAHMVEGAYPGRRLGPMMVSRSVGTGRLLCCAADLAAAAIPGQPEDADTVQAIASAALWAAAAPPPIASDAPPSVEIAAWANAEGMVVFLVNQAVNQVGGRRVVRWVAPAHDIELTIQMMSGALAVHAVTGRQVRWENRDGRLSIFLERLDAYEAIMIEGVRR